MSNASHEGRFDYPLKNEAPNQRKPKKAIFKYAAARKEWVHDATGAAVAHWEDREGFKKIEAIAKTCVARRLLVDESLVEVGFDIETFTHEPEGPRVIWHSGPPTPNSPRS